MRSFLILPMLLLPGMAQALDLAMPAPVDNQESQSEAPASVRLPTGPFADGALPTELLEGALDRRAWRLKAQGMSLTELASPLRQQLLDQGYTIQFDCETRGCGGFDFRFAIEVMAEPGMHVDLGDFRFIAAKKGDEVVNLLVSRSPGFGFVQLTRMADQPMADTMPAVVTPAAQPEIPAAPQPTAPISPMQPPGDLAAALEATGAVVLEDLVFGSGSSSLEPGEYVTLAALAAWLVADSARRVALVGHTDNSGGMEGNITLSKKRAQAVRAALLKLPGVAAGQVTAEGVGPLAPRTSNASEAGRQKNRRVEVVVTSTQ